MANDLVGKQFLVDARNRAQDVLGAEHIGADVKDLIKDLLHACSNFEESASNSAGASSDIRVLRKKMDQTRAELKAMESKFEGAKAIVLSLTPELKNISAETGAILKRFEATPTDANHVSAMKIKAATQKMAEAIIKSSQG